MKKIPTVKEMSDYIQNELCVNVNSTEIMPYCSSSRFDVVEIFRTKKKIKIYEIKSCRQDFVSDKKWEKYLKYCTNFGFVTPEGVINPAELPKKVGLIEIYKHKGKLNHFYMKKFGRINKEIDIKNYIKVLEGFAGSMSWRYQELQKELAQQI